MKSVLQKYSRDELAAVPERAKMLMEMSVEVANTSKPIKIELDGETISLNQRLLNSLTKQIYGRLPGLFKLKIGKGGISYNPVVLNKDTISFLTAIKDDLGALEGDDLKGEDATKVIDAMPLMFKRGLADQKTIDATWYAYVNVAELYKGAHVNEKVTDGNYYKQYVAPDAKMKKYLKKPLEHLISEVLKGDYDDKKIKFKDNKKTVESLQDFQIFNYNRIKKKLVKTSFELSPEEKKLLAHPKSDALMKEYETKLYEAFISAQLDEQEFLDDKVFLEIAVEVLKNAKIGDYTPEQIHELDVVPEAKALALRAGIASERNFMSRFKKAL